ITNCSGGGDGGYAGGSSSYDYGSHTTPETRNDCSGSATQNANAAQSVLNQPSLATNIDRIRNQAQFNDVEYSFSIQKNGNNYLPAFMDIGTYGHVSLEYDSNTIYTVHSHHECDQLGNVAFSAPSFADLIYVLDRFGTGIKLYQKENKFKDFKEQQTVPPNSENNYSYQPKICP
ncbi:MAG: hypothetical protein LBJ72_13110, partial [Dysgonamonadaceae bacterium]|nr:hypothetical protein [Dysgonamonadaceae bacterium]